MQTESCNLIKKSDLNQLVEDETAKIKGKAIYTVNLKYDDTHSDQESSENDTDVLRIKESLGFHKLSCIEIISISYKWTGFW